MTQTMLIVYRENCFSVDLRENPMFAGVKNYRRLTYRMRSKYWVEVVGS